MNYFNCIPENATRGEIKTNGRGGRNSSNKIAVRYLRDGCVIVYKLMCLKINGIFPRDRYDIIIQSIGEDRSVEESRAEDTAVDFGEAHGLFRTLVRHKVTPCTLADIIHDRKIG